MKHSVQLGPPLTVLEQLVPDVAYKDGWKVELVHRRRMSEHLAGGAGPTLVVRALVWDSATGQETRVAHLFSPPPASWDRRTWTRWVFDCIMQVELHEAMEFFAVGDRKPFFPAHGADGASPYEIRESD